MKSVRAAKKPLLSAAIALLVLAAPLANALAPLQTWNLTATTANWKAVACDSTCLIQYAGVYGGYLFKSTDGGGSWSQLTSAGSRNWNSLATSSNGNYVTAVDYGGYVYQSNDAGITWNSVAVTGNWRAVSIEQTGATQVAVLTGGSIYLSSDYGATWTAQVTPGTGNWSAVNINYPGTVIAATIKNGNIWVASKSAGSWSWTNKTSSGNLALNPTDSNPLNAKGWTGIVISDTGNRIVAVNDNSVGGGAGNIFYSSDTGTVWTEINVGNYQWQSIAGTSDLLTIMTASNNGCGTNCRMHYRNGTTFGTWAMTYTGVNNSTAYQLAIARDGSRGIAPIYGGQLQYAGTVISTATISLTINNGLFRNSTSITASISPSTGGKTTFYANGKRIAGCIAKATTGSSVICSFRPSVRGALRIYAEYTPTDTAYVKGTSLYSTILVGNRANTR